MGNGGKRGSAVHFGVKLSAKCIHGSFWVGNGGKKGFSGPFLG